MGGAKLRWALKCPFHKMVKAGQGAGFVQLAGGGAMSSSSGSAAHLKLLINALFFSSLVSFVM